MPVKAAEISPKTYCQYEMIQW